MKLDRRRVLGVGLAAGAAPLAGAATLRGTGPAWSPNEANYPTAGATGGGYVYFTQAEAAFVEAASQRMIPADELGPGAVEAGVPVFIDRQLAGDYGKASRMYMQGPWPKGSKEQGYQGRFTPAELYRRAIPAIDGAVGRASSTTFAKLGGEAQDTFLKQLQTGAVDLGAVDAAMFFGVLLRNVIEGFFSDPIYGGNRDMAGWRLIGFSGARYDQTEFVTQHGVPYPLPPVGISGRPAWTAKG